VLRSDRRTAKDRVHERRHRGVRRKQDTGFRVWKVFSFDESFEVSRKNQECLKDASAERNHFYEGGEDPPSTRR
jgi:hypothetical protein